jgi:hypothetical protein
MTGGAPTWLRPLPEVLLLGAMRAGTTFLHRALSAHPGIAPMRIKEPQFFTLHWAEGAAAYRRGAPLRGPQWAYRLVGRRRPLSIDASPYYLFHPEAPRRASALLGARFKAIVLLRDPAERAWSHYRFAVARGWETLPFEDALAAEEARLAGEAERLARGEERVDAPHQLFSYAGRGRYAEQLERWWATAPRERFLLVESADLFADPQGQLARVCDFLGLPAAPAPAGLPRHAAPPAELSASARRACEALFDAPNQRLLDLTGIDLGRRRAAQTA